MQHIRSRQVILFLLVLSSLSSFAQKELNLIDHDSKPYYFGITLSGNQSRFQFSHHSNFLTSDSISVIESPISVGFGLGLSANLNLNRFFEARFNPQLVFANKVMEYNLKTPAPGESPVETKTVESIVVSFPIHLKLKSDRIDNFRVYSFSGLKLDYDLASNAKARQADDLVKIKGVDPGFEFGAGFEFYFPSFILAPEVKISKGLSDIHSRDQNLKFSNVVERLNSRMIIFTIHLQG